MNLSIIVAVATNNAIGRNNDLIWHISDDLKRFKKITSGHSIIMGRKTFDSIGRALPKRRNIIISRQENLVIEGVEIVNSLKKALELTKDETEVFIIGGGTIYAEALPLANKLYLTEVHSNPEADVFFPEINCKQWKETFRENCSSDDYSYSFVDLERI